MQVININSGNMTLFQTRNISHTKLEKENKDFSNKNFVAQALAMNDKEVAPKALITNLTKKYGEDFFDGVGRNANNEITFGDLDKHLKGQQNTPRIATSMKSFENENITSKGAWGVLWK